MPYNKKLSSIEWGNLYNIEKTAEPLIRSIQNETFSAQTEEMLKIIKRGDRTLEIGSGSGQTSLCMAQRGCHVTLLDFSQSALDLARYTAETLNININTVCHDATCPLPFEAYEFDYIFHAGLFEHFEKDERISLLKEWNPYCKKMISMVPNGASLGYRFGKAKRESNGTWAYGRELNIYSQIHEFILSGFDVEHEYTVGELRSLNFLDNDDAFKMFMVDFWNGEGSKFLSDNCHQGYLLVTSGSNVNYQPS